MKMKKRLQNILILAFQVTLIFSCSSSDIKDKGKRKKKDDLVIIHTAFGDMTVLLYEETPLHKANFLDLAKSGAYDSTKWHRVIEKFVVQGGNIDDKKGGSPSNRKNVPAEIVEGFYHHKGALAAARQSDQVNPEKESSPSQFYVIQGKQFTEQELTVDQFALQRSIGQLLSNPNYDTLRQKFQQLAESRDNEGLNELAMSLTGLVEAELGTKVTKDISEEKVEIYSQQGGTPQLDGEYTVFGKVVSGLDVIDKLAAVKTNRMDRPNEDIYMTMEVITMKTKEITQKYGYNYPED